MITALVGDKEVEVDVWEMADKIDDVFHNELTSKTGITVDHHDIARFIVSIVNKNNEKEKEFTKTIKDVEEALKKKEEQLKYKK